jgi:CubicO group peptidase (beta-lactamase class C family)
MAKSVTSLMSGRAMTLGLISPDDPVGALLPEADGPHGAITMRDLLTMTSGLRWNGLRDYNIATPPPARRPGCRSRSAADRIRPSWKRLTP